MDDLTLKVGVFRKRIVDIIRENAASFKWEYISDNQCYKTKVGSIDVTVSPYKVVITDEYANTYTINTDGVLFRSLQSSNNTLQLNDIVVKMSYKEMRSLDIDIEPIDAYIIVGTEKIRFRLYYSFEEDIYFGYTRDLELQDIPHCRILEYKDYLKRQHISDYDLRPQSVLYSYGYKVTDTTDEYRHKVLKFVIDERIMGWGEIINFLEWLMSMRKNDQNCVAIWDSDIDWIREYVSGNRIRKKNVVY